MRTKKGTITATKMTGTVTVTVHRELFHPVYKKRYRMSKKFLADTTGQTDLAVGDEVVITECRPLSKRKHFRLTEVLKRAPRVSEVQEEGELASVMQRKRNNVTDVSEVTEVTDGKKKKTSATSATSDTSATSSQS